MLQGKVTCHDIELDVFKNINLWKPKKNVTTALQGNMNVREKTWL